MAQKKHILVFIDWFLPAYKAGGQIPSVFNITKLLSKDFDFSVVTSNSDEGEPPFENVIFDQWTTYNDLRILYLSVQNQNIKFYNQLFKNEKFDAIYLNSFFSFRFTLLPLWALRKAKPNLQVILAPRGMLANSALNIKSFKKRSFLFFAKQLGFYKNITWHASSEFEAQEIETIFGNNTGKIKIASDISILPQRQMILKEKKKNQLKLFYLSRITNKKNLFGALKMLLPIKAGNVEFDIIGPIGNSEYWQDCLKLIEQMPENIKINYLGAIPNFELYEQLKKYHFFLFPTLNENYGHVIAESLAAACPVILSNQTPWTDLEQHKAGWIVDIDLPDVFTEKIKFALDLDAENYNVMANNAIEYIFSKTNVNELIEINKEVFL